MEFISTRGQAPAVSFKTALFQGLAPDGGLYVPAQLDPQPRQFFDDLDGASLVETATAVAAVFLDGEMSRAELARLLSDALNFPIPLAQVDHDLWALELFHGPTCAFKDVGARVMARLMAHFHGQRDPLTVLVATSGDTGSAVAQAFFGVEGTRVVVLFPEGQVTRVQEAQFTTLGGNVMAVAVHGTFDDCQRLVKEAFCDGRLRARARLTSANSINIGRLLPQTFYYVHAAGRAGPDPRPATRDTPPPTSAFARALRWRASADESDSRRLTVSVPSGNFGNLTAGLLAWKLGAPIRGFVAATTINDTLPRFLRTGRYEPRASVSTLANAMDVGNPSNVERMRWLFHDDLDRMRAVITPSVHTDADVREAIGELWRRHGYIADPHSAIGYLGAKQAKRPTVFLATAHPAKFRETVEPIIGQPVPLPPALQEALEKPRHVERIPPTLSSLTALL